MKKLMAANWKMNKTCAEAAQTVEQLAALINGQILEDRELLIFAPFTALEASSNAMQAIPGGMIGAQNLYPTEDGAITGEISPRMITSCGASWVLTGHSERRHILGEDNIFVGKKTAFALYHGLRVVLCVGETLEQREAGNLGEVLELQLLQGLAGILDYFNPEYLAIAYEPVWAIGTGRTAEPFDIIDAHAMIRDIVKDILGPQGLNVRLLYGGSVNPGNVASIVSLDNVDGVLVGGASLDAEKFYKILTA